MKRELRYIGEKIVKNEEILANRISQLIDSDYSSSLSRAGAPDQELLAYRAELVRYFGLALYEEKEMIQEHVIRWGRKAARFAMKYQVSLSNALRAVSFYRTILWDVFTDELAEKQFAAITMLDVSKIIDPLIDKVLQVMSEVYEKRNTELMNIAYSAVEELSVPVVVVTKGIAVIPLIGTIDTNRAQLIMETALNEGSRLQLDSLILDVSGVPIIDTMVADQLYKIITALKLSGIEPLITGIRPELAQTIVNIGLHFNEVTTQSSLENALKQLGFRIEKSW
ncbi:STAS domain-containing protein [Robertmurraya korlensis]|uniref:STAS domain-containing protein n=1 Tax=Robertmurraya korlensis TaxID=519977 RepID=UPI00203AB4B0|nr:STAS domain-containing protein [Robertmurraya korlensis]